MRIIKVIFAVMGVVVLTAFSSYAWTVVTKPQVETAITIKADAATVWEVLTDFDSYAEWNPFIIESAGEPVAGSTLRNTLRNGGTELQFEPTITVADEGKELRWLGRFLIPGIVDGEHYFLIEEVGPSQVRVVHGENFRGALVPFAGSALDVEDGFAAMNTALKTRAEDRARDAGSA